MSGRVATIHFKDGEQRFVIGESLASRMLEAMPDALALEWAAFAEKLGHVERTCNPADMPTLSVHEAREKAAEKEVDFYCVMADF